MTNEELGGVLRDVASRHEAWFKYFQRWRVTFWLCGVLAATASAASASKVAGDLSPALALLSSVCIAVLGFANPQRRANAYVAAWRVLGSAQLRYKAGEANVSDLLAAVDKGEAIISESDVAELRPKGVRA